MTAAVGQFVLSGAVICVAGVYLARASDAIADLTGVGRLLAGSILLAAATSLPELFVDLAAVRAGMPNLAMGDLAGSSLVNLFVLAVADLIHRGHGRIFSRASAAHALSAAMSMHVTALAGIAVLAGPVLAPFELGGIGVGPLLIAGAYGLGLRLVYADQSLALAAMTTANAGRVQAANTSGQSDAVGRTRALTRVGVIYCACALLILGAAPWLADAAGRIAEISGLGGTFVGSTLVALTTSLPEWASTLAAVRMGAFDLAVGNIFGSNAFNMLLLVPLDFFHEGSLLAAISISHGVTLFAVILATSVAVMGQLYQVERRRGLIEPDAWAVMAIVGAALGLLHALG